MKIVLKLINGYKRYCRNKSGTVFLVYNVWALVLVLKQQLAAAADADDDDASDVKRGQNSEAKTPRPRSRPEPGGWGKVVKVEAGHM